MQKIKEAFLATVLGGVVGALLVGAFYTWPFLYGAKWWEAMTAIGTVGAAIGAAYAAYIALTVSKREAKRVQDEKEKYINTQVHILSEWGNRAEISLRELDSKLQKLEQTPSLWREPDSLTTKRALERLRTDSLPLSLDKIHNLPNGEAWAFCISRAASLSKDLQESFNGKIARDPTDLSRVLLRDNIAEILHVLSQISVSFVWNEYNDSE